MLYIIATPIGNLKDITYRAVETMKNCKYILCEDTRISAVLLNHYNIKAKLISYHKFNEKSITEQIQKIYNEGDIALISDAGMPGISDPGSVLVNYFIKNNLAYTVLPGACAAINAFVLSGFLAPFMFIGFLPSTKREIVKLLTNLKNIKSTLIFYSSPHKIKNEIDILHTVLGNRKIMIARELTKKFEEVKFGTLQDGYKKEPKGEYILVVEPEANKEIKKTEKDIKKALVNYIESGIQKKDAIKLVCEDFNLSKAAVYKLSINI